MSRIFEFSIHVPYAHIDKMGIVYYANYLVYFEMARARLLREAGVPYGELEARGVMLPVVEAHCDYRKSAHYDDLLVVYSTVAIEKLRIRIDCRVTRDGETLAEGYTRHICVTPAGKVLRPAPELVAIAEGAEPG
jgi:acyl-CoA thioester hydrolase